jgi:hypothetical protein
LERELVLKILAYLIRRRAFTRNIGAGYLYLSDLARSLFRKSWSCGTRVEAAGEELTLDILAYRSIWRTNWSSGRRVDAGYLSLSEHLEDKLEQREKS